MGKLIFISKIIRRVIHTKMELIDFIKTFYDTQEDKKP